VSSSVAAFVDYDPDPDAAAWGGRMVARLRDLVVAEYGDTCWLCRRPILGTVTVDHVIPRSLGGTNDLVNLRPAHGRCNSSRGNRAPRPPVLVAASRAW
jgi:5-methylcytosine-specific restriction endonuclease McrA